MNLTSLLNLPILLLIKYTILEQMSRKISQINFSFIRHLYVGDVISTLTDYEQVSSAFHGFRARGGVGGVGGGLGGEGWDVL